MSARASLRLVGGSSFDFITGKTAGGRIPDYPIAVLEDLTTDGVDYRRHLLNRKEFRIFEFRTMAQASDYDAAVVLARNYELGIGYTGNLTTIIRGRTYTFSVYVVDVPESPIVMAGAPVGSDVTVGSGGGVTCRWMLELLTIPTAV